MLRKMFSKCTGPTNCVVQMTTFPNINLESIHEYDMQDKMLDLDKDQTGSKKVIKWYPLRNCGDTLIVNVFLLKRKVFSPHQPNTTNSKRKKTKTLVNGNTFGSNPDFGTPSESLFSWSGFVNTHQKSLR